MEGTTSYQYNEDGKLLSVATPDGDTVSYTYNEKGLKAGITYPDGSQVQYAYDSMGRLGSVTGLDGGITEYEYDAAGRRTKTVSENRTITYTYDEGNRLTGLNVAGDVQLSFGYTYDKNGSMTSETLSGDGMDTTSRYTYDLAGQLTGFSRTDGYEERYAYDPAGNMTERICKAQGGEEYALSMAYDQSDRLVRMERAAKERKITGIVYRYDENGNLTSKTSDIGTDTYHYNAMDQLTSYEGYDGYQAKYAYQDTGVLLRKETKGNLSRLTQEEVLEGKSVSGEIDIEEGEAGIGAADIGSQTDAGDWIVTSYVYDINQEYAQVLSETTQGQTTCYEYGLERISAYGPDGKTDYLYDGRGSVAEQLTTGTDLAENVKKVIKSYTPYGEQLNEKLFGFGYNGEEYDSATGMVYLRARWYEPAMARFAQKDIERGHLTDTISQNRYLYAANDPVNYTDPSGEFLVKRQTVWDRFGQTVKSVVEPNSNQNAKTRMPSVDRKSILNHTRPLTPFESMIAPQIYQEEVRSKVEWKNKYSGSPIKDPGWGNYTETLQKVEQQEKKARDAKLENFAETICKANGLSDKIDKKTYQSLSSQEKLLYICAEAEKKRKYESFWNRKDGYFGGNWWQDERKVKEATHMLLLEADQNHGVIDLPQTSASGDKNKIYTLQVLLNVKRTGYYDHTMLTSYEAMQVREKKTNDPHKIEARDIKKMYEEYETWPYKKLDNFMENGGEDIVTGIFILTLDGITRFDNQEHDSYETSENKGVGNPINR